MIFQLLALSEDEIVTAKATGHPTDVIEAFHKVSSLLLSPKGPWRITTVTGTCSEEAYFDSQMEWILVAKTKK